MSTQSQSFGSPIVLTAPVGRYPNNTRKYASVDNIPNSGRNKLNIPEIYAYNVISDQDHDILNQGTISHIKNYFDKKQKESEEKDKGLMNIIDMDMQPDLTPDESAYSINSIGFLIKLVIILLFVWLLWDFLLQEKLE